MSVAAYFDEVVVGVAEVDGRHWSERAGAIDRPQFDGNPVVLQSIDYLVQRYGGDQAVVR